MTQLFCVVGDPISHSLSPLIHNGWHRDLGINAEYAAAEVPKGDFAEALGTFTRENFCGLNVTLPHKVAALQASTSHSPDCARIGAANTLIRIETNQWHAHNTDVSGFRDAVTARWGDIRGASALIIGAGGAARGVCAALSDLGVSISIANRTRERAEDLCRDLGLEGLRVLPLDAVTSDSVASNLFVNCLSVGHDGTHLQLPQGHGRMFFDISYGKAAAPTLNHATRQGWQTEDGLAMLVGQAADSFELWHGVAPDRANAMTRCRAALEAIS
ncbi:MAG: shikimate dehydrogenase [Pseudomonadota bacterium]